MGWVHPSGLGGQNAAVGIEDTGSPPHPRRLGTFRPFHVLCHRLSCDRSLVNSPSQNLVVGAPLAAVWLLVY